MKKLLQILLVAVAVAIAIPQAAMAQFGVPLTYPTSTSDTRQNLYTYGNFTPYIAHPRVISNPADPDMTGYPFINNWKNHVDENVTVFLNDQERDQITQARITESNSLNDVFMRHDLALRAFLSPEQATKFDDIMASQDMAKLAAMSTSDWSGYMANLQQRLHLNCDQESLLRIESDRLVAEAAPIQAQFAATFNTTIAAAEQRVAAENAEYQTIGTPPPGSTPPNNYPTQPVQPVPPTTP